MKPLLNLKTDVTQKLRKLALSPSCNSPEKSGQTLKGEFMVFLPNISLIIICLCLATQVLAQSPQAFKYQAIARDNAGNVLVDQSVNFRMSILESSAAGAMVYSETHLVTTSEFGLVNFEIGNGIVGQGQFDAIDWGANEHFLEVGVDENGGSNFNTLGTSQLLSIPYALYAETSGSSIPGPQGSTGSTGPAGATGPAGSSGTTGATGAQGTKGDTGAAGAQGVQGEKGDTGDIGVQGDQGDVGAAGAQGTQGDKGDKGDAGTQGVQGETGLQGVQGIQGDPGVDGSDGPGGIQGDQGVQGDVGNDGANGASVLNGTTAPTTEGIDGDFYINTATSEIYGPKTTGAWGSASPLIGADGANGNDGANGASVLNGTTAPTTEGIDGDFYINTTTSEIYGPKTTGTWGSATALIGTTGPQGPAGSGGGSSATYRYAEFHTYSNGGTPGWALNNEPAMFGGLTPTIWTDASGAANQMSPDKEVLRTLFQRKGYATKSALIFNDEWASFSSTNGRVVLALFRIENTTGGEITWSPEVAYSCYAGWGERASVALNGVSIMYEGTSGIQTVALPIPASRISTVIMVSTSGIPSGGVGMRRSRLAILNGTLELPAGLQFIDDLDTATGGWEQ